MNADERAASWVEAMHPRLAGLQDFLLPEGFPFDFSTRSLAELEPVLVGAFGSAAAVEQDAEDNPEGFALRAAGYVGEILMRAGGGSWGWDERSDRPLVVFDDALGLPAASPLGLIGEVAERGRPDVLVDALDAVNAAVAERRRRHPGWSPVKVPTPALDEDSLPPDRGTLAAWRRKREATFPAWAAEYAGDDAPRWDFSVDSLRRLESLVRSRLSAEADFAKPENVGFVEGASWYLGEVIVRHTPAEWVYIEGERTENNVWVGRPFVRQIEPPRNSAAPEITLMSFVEFGGPDYLRATVALFED